LYREGGLTPERLVFGTITVIAWQAPIPAERSQPVPPSDTEHTAIGYLATAPQVLFSSQAPVQPLVRAFGRGGLPARVTGGISTPELALFAIFTTLLVVLEAAGWSFARLHHERVWLHSFSSAAAEALRITAEREQRPWLPMFRFLVPPWILRIVLWLAPRVFPFDIGMYVGALMHTLAPGTDGAAPVPCTRVCATERYLQYHFTKVGDQTELYINRTVASGRQLRLPTERIEALCARNPRWAAGRLPRTPSS
jgi:hypothetical protein